MKHRYKYSSWELHTSAIVYCILYCVSL